ncbi:hypothetical protein F5878DRAFT_617025 [Lentinula raphanica]|uniref:Uncharacterized protein n=1 Tax=Lentinula raphanica TaxID=153919 RepID=A0AA38PAR8_9AGAR|nr:hypothetical protein F5878DRAFT_617025 [Lentinula raphanica]
MRSPSQRNRKCHKRKPGRRIRSIATTTYTLAKSQCLETTKAAQCSRFYLIQQPEHRCSRHTIQVLLQQLPFFPHDRAFKQLTGFVSPINESDQRRTTGSQTPMLNDSPSSRPSIASISCYTYSVRTHAAVDNVVQNMRSADEKIDHDLPCPNQIFVY